MEKTNQKGFTLVELAVVMIIIGLLIGGILKGQELINNAQVSSTVAQIKGMDAAIGSFRDAYASLPGDLQNPAVRLPNCAAAPCSTVGDSDGDFDILPTAAAAAQTATIFAQLNAADLLTGVDGSGNLFWGQALPASNVGGGFTIGTRAAGALGQNGSPIGRHYLSLRSAPGVAAGATGVAAMTGNQARRIDLKLDDGASDTGSVFAAQAICENGAGIYDEVSGNADCDLFIRVQG